MQLSPNSTNTGWSRQPGWTASGGRAVWTAMAVAVMTAACAGGSAAPAGEPLPDPGAAAAEITAATVPTERRQINFDWTLDEAGSRVRGRGVVRLQSPDRLRLDLFGPRNETYLAAALVGYDARLPPGTRTDVAIPSPALLWAGLGTVRPPQNATLRDAASTGAGTVLRYSAGADEIYEYTVSVGGEIRLQQLQRLGSRGPVETVRLDWSDTGELRRATYRDWSAYRDLTLDIQSSVAAEPFPDAIWTP